MKFKIDFYTFREKEFDLETNYCWKSVFLREMNLFSSHQVKQMVIVGFIAKKNKENKVVCCIFFVMMMHINSHPNAFHAIAMSSRFCKQMLLFCYFCLIILLIIIVVLTFYTIYYSCFYVLFSFSFISSVYTFLVVPRSQNMVKRNERMNKKRSEEYASFVQFRYF